MFPCASVRPGKEDEETGNTGAEVGIETEKSGNWILQIPTEVVRNSRMMLEVVRVVQFVGYGQLTPCTLFQYTNVIN